MSGMIAIELNDAGIRVADVSGLLADSPGYAHLSEDGMQFGQVALGRAKLEPSLSFNRYWQHLDDQPLPRAHVQARSQADLVHGHLKALWSGLNETPEDVVLVLPGTWSRDQIGLLLGIAEALDMPVRLLVDASLAAAEAPTDCATLLHLDLHLHQAVLSTLTQTDTLSVTAAQRIDDVGLIGFREDWARSIGRRFVRETRFDPLHRAQSEQALHDALPTLLKNLRSEGRDTLELATGETPCPLTLGRVDLETASSARVQVLLREIDRLAATDGVTEVQLTARSAEVPGLIQAIDAEQGLRTQVLPADAAVLGGLDLATTCSHPTHGVAWIRSRPLNAAAASGLQVGGEDVTEGPSPTHLLYQERAHAIGPHPLVVGRAPPAGVYGLRLEGELHGVSREHCSIRLEPQGAVLKDLSRYGTYLNGRRLDAEAYLRAGDRVRIGTPGVELLLIQAVGHGEAP